MHLLKKVRQQLHHHLWQSFCQQIESARHIVAYLKQQQQEQVILDHFAIIDIPGKHAGIPYLYQLFSALGYIVQGCDYLPDKQNDFLWVTEYEAASQTVSETLPQIVLADFRLEEMPLEVKKIIEKYAATITHTPLTTIQQLAGKTYLGDNAAAQQLSQLLTTCFTGRSWTTPTVNDFNTVHEFNELLAWALVFGRIPNHYTISVHLLKHYNSLADFNQQISHALQLPMNQQGGNLIKGNPELGLIQSASLGKTISLQLADGVIQIAEPFMEFIWRYPKSDATEAHWWRDYHTGFIAQYADKVIESLYDDASTQ